MALIGVTALVLRNFIEFSIFGADDVYVVKYEP